MRPHAKLSLALVTMLTLTACSTPPTGSETSKAILGAWGDTLPTASRNDTPQTKLEIGTNRTVYFELCGKFKACSPTLTVQ